MATVEEFIGYANSVCNQIQAKNQEIKMLLGDALDPRLGTNRAWITAVVDYASARTDYLVLKAELDALVASLPEALGDVPEPEEP